MPPGLSDPSIIAAAVNLAIVLCAIAALIAAALVLRWIAPVHSSALPHSYEADETDWHRHGKKEI